MYKNIHIGKCIQEIAEIKDLSISRACSFLKCSHLDIKETYKKKSIDTEELLAWCKLLDYNFFMFYHSHLQLYSPSSSLTKIPKHKDRKTSNHFTFRKNLYTPEIIHFILNKLVNQECRPSDIIEKYGIPRTTLYRWKKKWDLKDQEKKDKPPVKRKSDNNQPLFKSIYTDLINEMVFKENAVKSKLLNKVKDLEENNLSYEKISSINSVIKNQNLYNYDELKYSQLMAYDVNFVKKVLQEQKLYNLSDVEISNKYKMSRNTVRKWKQFFGDNYQNQSQL